MREREIIYLRSVEDLARDSLEVLGVSVALHVVGQLPEGHLGSCVPHNQPFMSVCLCF